MRCASRAERIGGGRALARLAAIVFVLAFGVTSAQAQLTPTPTPTPTPTASPTPTPTPSPTPQMINSAVSSTSTITNLGSSFLERFGTTSGFSRMMRTNPGGGGASEAAETPRYRTWFEGYGISANNGPLGFFVGDKRKTWGGVAGIGARIATGVNVGFSVDQSRTDIDVPLALQSAGIDLTQFGFNASVDAGPWTWASVIVHGFGNINSRRDTGLGFATAGYNARLDGVLSEISYYWSKDQYRIVPKGAVEYVRAQTGAFQEFGGLDPVTATGASVQRFRVLVGAEVGHYWIFDQKILDLSAYGKFVNNVVQNFSDTTVSLGAQSVTFQGIGESQYGADAGASASLSLTNTARLYINYDAKFRAAMQSHQGTFGLELKW
ncbi:autotransporter outer membrane beta-barrel domain-containing protein [Bradyrhizobium sp. OAE829]|uniref:autotransporter outer membrane beta-barrel domain-containing protein n=1 Tax=Bradyrhizobium sp. OAE829 TaxID=2663807 RepID=UPI00178A6402